MYRVNNSIISRGNRLQTPSFSTRKSSDLSKADQIDLKVLSKEPLINEVGEWNRESCHLGFSD
ncbi:hypothetical protein CVV70_12050 [Ralstonia solanacearum]|nr:hypothetical protein CVV70_12050 [Ralstonia solanacearum]